jgi:hypothetical protein
VNVCMRMFFACIYAVWLCLPCWYSLSVRTRVHMLNLRLCMYTHACLHSPHTHTHTHTHSNVFCTILQCAHSLPVYAYICMYCACIYPLWLCLRCFCANVYMCVHFSPNYVHTCMRMRTHTVRLCTHIHTHTHTHNHTHTLMLLAPHCSACRTSSQ